MVLHVAARVPFLRERLAMLSAVDSATHRTTVLRHWQRRGKSPDGPDKKLKGSEAQVFVLYQVRCAIKSSNLP